MAASPDAEVAFLRLHRPGPPLDRHVAGIWRVRGVVPVAAETVLPNGVVELIFNLGRPHRVVAPGPGRWFREAWLAGRLRDELGAVNPDDAVPRRGRRVTVTPATDPALRCRRAVDRG